ncbi:hypothetical protein ABZ348_03020 [Streptomyces sp. NPDC005963]|uniref:hypothetical protein n=1 Tax=Streptomyces sp. NPDC005963 TaxID=3156721 RepID=UPI0033E3A971
MTASQKTNSNQTRRSSRSAAKSEKAAETPDEVQGALALVPAPLTQKTQVALHALRGAVGPAGTVWSAIGARKALSGGVSVASLAALGCAYALGRRMAPRHRGPLTRLTGGRI